MMKSKRTIFRNLLIALGIIGFSVLPYVHDFEFFKGKEGFSGFSSLRIGIWVVSMFVIALAGWVGFFLKAKGKEYRFAILVPICMIAFQLSIYLLDARKTTTNEITTKVWVNFGFAVFLVLAYFLNKPKNQDE